MRHEQILDAIKPFDKRHQQTWLDEPGRLLFLTKHGSHAYGLNTETSDLDLKGIAIAPRNYYYGFLNRFEQAEGKLPEINAEYVIFELQKFMKLAADCNPNIIEILFTDRADFVHMAYPMEELIHHRRAFLSQKARHTFSGYAVAQLKRIKGHFRWVKNPPKEPRRSDYDLPEHEAGLVNQERAYEAVKADWDKYVQWKKTRNATRAELEMAHGYDTKHAMHLVRLMRMAREILETGEVLVKRPDREELLAIRRGAWEYERLVEWAERQDSELEALVANSPLPHSPNRQFLDDLCVEIITGTNYIGPTG